LFVRTKSGFISEWRQRGTCCHEKVRRIATRRRFSKRRKESTESLLESTQSPNENPALNFPRGWVAEWSNAHAWKACLPQGNGGSNPPPSAPRHAWGATLAAAMARRKCRSFPAMPRQEPHAWRGY